MKLWHRFTWWAWRRKRARAICMDILVGSRMNPNARHAVSKGDLCI